MADGIGLDEIPYKEYRKYLETKYTCSQCERTFQPNLRFRPTGVLMKLSVKWPKNSSVTYTLCSFKCLRKFAKKNLKHDRKLVYGGLPIE